MPMRMAYGNLRTVLILFDAANLMLLRPFHVCGLRTSALGFARLRMPPFAYLPSTASTLVVRQASNFAAAWCFQENLLSVLAACLALFQNGDPHMPGVPAYYIPRAQHLCQRCNLHALHHSDINVRHFMLGYPAMQPALRLNSVSPACFEVEGQPAGYQSQGFAQVQPVPPKSNAHGRDVLCSASSLCFSATSWLPTGAGLAHNGVMPARH